MADKTKKTPVPNRTKKASACFKDEPWYQSTRKTMSIADRRNEEVRFSMNFLPFKGKGRPNASSGDEADINR